VSQEVLANRKTLLYVSPESRVRGIERIGNVTGQLSCTAISLDA
jgi:hypothetical protein